jgi:enoyl-CoA hydratase
MNAQKKGPTSIDRRRKVFNGLGQLAIQYCMETLNQGVNMMLPEGLFLEATLFGICRATEDKKEGATAFVESRAADFQGK